MGVLCSDEVEKDDATLGGIDLGFSGRINQKTKSGKVGHDPISSYNSSDLEGKPKSPETNERTINKPKFSGIGRASVAGLERTFKVLAAFGSSISYFNTSSAFAAAIAPRSRRISVLAFEVANTITKGANLSHSLSEQNIQVLTKEILQSHAVQLLVSNNMEELLIIAADDKRLEYDIFAQEVIRFGDLCKNPLWHNLGRYFSRLDLEDVSQVQIRAEGEKTMQELTTLAQHTSELYHESHALDRLEQDYRRKLVEVKSWNHQGGVEVVAVLRQELNVKRKLVRRLKKKSLWSRNLEEIVKKLVDVVVYIHKSISEAFEHRGERRVNNGQQRLGFSGLALHYANIINQINSIASRPFFVPSNMREALFHGLPPSVRTALRSQMRDILVKEEFSFSRVKAEMNETLQWLLPLAINTHKLNQTFGWIGEWANSSTSCSNESVSGKSKAMHGNIIRLQTLYHADKHTTEEQILNLVTWLQVLISFVRHKNHHFRPLSDPSPTLTGNPGQETGLFLRCQEVRSEILKPVR